MDETDKSVVMGLLMIIVVMIILSSYRYGFGFNLSFYGCLISGTIILITSITKLILSVVHKDYEINPIIIFGVLGWIFLLLNTVFSLFTALAFGVPCLYSKSIWVVTLVLFLLGLIILIVCKVLEYHKFISMYSLIINMLGVGFWLSIFPWLYQGEWHD